MKIKINNIMSVDLDLPDETNIAELGTVLETLHKINKVFGSGILLDSVKTKSVNYVPRNRGSYSKRKWTREQVIEIVKISYENIPNPEKDVKLMEKFNMHYAEARSRRWSFCKRYNISPADVGLVKFSNRGQTEIERLPQ